MKHRHFWRLGLLVAVIALATTGSAMKPTPVSLEQFLKSQPPCLDQTYKTHLRNCILKLPKDKKPAATKWYNDKFLQKWRQLQQAYEKRTAPNMVQWLGNNLGLPAFIGGSILGLFVKPTSPARLSTKNLALTICAGLVVCSGISYIFTVRANRSIKKELDQELTQFIENYVNGKTSPESVKKGKLDQKNTKKKKK
jgi:hypothetical protein